MRDAGGAITFEDGTIAPLDLARSRIQRRMDLGRFQSLVGGHDTILAVEEGGKALWVLDARLGRR